MKNLIDNLSAQIALMISEKFLNLIEENFERLFINKVFDVAKVNIRPGDIILLRYPRVLRQGAYERIVDVTRQHFPNNKVILLEDGLELSTVSIDLNK